MSFIELQFFVFFFLKDLSFWRSELLVYFFKDILLSIDYFWISVMPNSLPFSQTLILHCVELAMLSHGYVCDAMGEILTLSFPRWSGEGE